VTSDEQNKLAKLTRGLAASVEGRHAGEQKATAMI
jgi:hypothetical protein